MDYPHLKDSSFPNVQNVDVYRYSNNFDYSKYDTMQMHIKAMRVPWDMGEVHVGQRTVSGIGNVVKFDTDADRDNWLDAQSGFAWDTKYRRFHSEDVIEIPLPYDLCSTFNYIVVDHEPLPVEYGDETGAITRWLYFIRSVEMKSPNCTIAHIKRDTWQTIVNRINITYAMLEQGHWPIAHSSVAKYLSNPMDNCQYLLAPDINAGTEKGRVKSVKTHVFNRNTYACFICSADPMNQSAFGTKADGWTMYSRRRYQKQGTSTLFSFCCAASNVNELLNDIDTYVPQFKSSIKGLFFAPTELLTLGDSFTFCTVACRDITANETRIDFGKLSQDDFAIPARYKHLAKLYTYPYSHIEITDENGNSSIVRVEDTAGDFDIIASLSIVYPWVNISASVTGIGGNVSGTYTYRAIGARNAYLTGRWYETLRLWDIPLLEVIQQSSVYNDYSTHYDRAQEAVAYNNAYSASDNDATLTTQNTSVETGAKTTINNTSVAAAAEDTGYVNDLADAINTNNVGVVNATAANNKEAANQSTAVSCGSTMANAAVGAATSLASGNVLGAVGSVAGGAISAVTTAAQNEITVNCNEAQRVVTVANMETKTSRTTANNTTRTTLQNNTNSANVSTSNTAATTIANNTAANIRTNAGLAKDTAQKAVTNSIAQASMLPPLEFGSYANGETHVTRPQMLQMEICTQDDYAIASAGDYFLKYGYQLGQYIEFEDFNVMPKFSYWKCSEIVVGDLEIPDLYMDEFRYFLLGGVTVWRKPEDIGHVTIYQNV